MFYENKGILVYRRRRGKEGVVSQYPNIDNKLV